MKYVIEIMSEYEDSIKGLMILGVKNSNLLVDALSVESLEELNSDYINEHFAELQDTAYQKGLDDAWEAAKKIFGYEIDGGLPVDELRSAFGWESGLFCTADIIRTNTASEALAKIQAYEERKKPDEIKVGDELQANDDPLIKIIVSQVKGDTIWGFNSEGTFSNRPNFDWHKTGRHFDQVAELLEATKGGDA